MGDHHRRMHARDKNYSVLSEEQVPIEEIASEILSTGEWPFLFYVVA